MECISTDISTLVIQRSQYSAYPSYTEVFYSSLTVSQFSQSNEHLLVTKISTSKDTIL